jgi:hypothetical protein
MPLSLKLTELGLLPERIFFDKFTDQSNRE